MDLFPRKPGAGTLVAILRPDLPEHVHFLRRFQEFKFPWRKASLLKSSRRFSGFGPGGCQSRSLSLSGWDDSLVSAELARER